MSSGNQLVAEPMEIEEAETSQPARTPPSSQPPAPVVNSSSSSTSTTSPAASEPDSKKNARSQQLEQEIEDPIHPTPTLEDPVQDTQREFHIVEHNTLLTITHAPSPNDNPPSLATVTSQADSQENDRAYTPRPELLRELLLPLPERNQLQNPPQESVQSEDIASASPVVDVSDISSEPSKTSRSSSHENIEAAFLRPETEDEGILSSSQQGSEVVNDNAEQQQFFHDDDFEMDTVQAQSESEEEPESDGEGPSTRISTVKSIPKRIIPERRAKTITVEQQAKSNAGKKRGAAPKRTPAKRANFGKLPVYWHTLACFQSRQFLNLDLLKDGPFKSQLVQFLHPTEETNLSDIISYKDDKSYEDTEKTLKKLFNDLEFQKLLFQADKQVVQDQTAKRLEEKKLTTVLLLGEKPTCKVPLLLYTFGFKEGVVVGENGKEIVEKASKFEIGENVNHVYKSEEFTYCTKNIGPEFPPTNFFASRGFKDSKDDGTGESSSALAKHQVPVVELDINDNDLERKATSLSVCLIRNAGKKIAADIFSPGNLEKICDSQKMVVLRQIGQHSTQNEQPGEQKSNFHVGTVYEKRNVKTFFGNLRKVMEATEKCVKKCIAKDLISEIDLLELQDELKETELPCKDIKTLILPLIICFGSNIDIDDKKDDKEKKQNYKKNNNNEKEKEALRKALQGLPAWTRPREGLMAILKDKLPGINRIQVYVKGPGCRTTAHYENEGIGSINVNLGPDDCVWFTISMKYSAQLEALLCKKKFAPCHDPIWLDEEDLQAAGIPYSKFLQKPNDMVFVNTGTYHWVQSNGFCTNVSWNILMEDKTQLAAAALFNDYNAMHKYDNALPIEKLIWSIAKEKKYPSSEISKLTKILLTSSLAHITMEQKSAENEGWVFRDGKNYLEDVTICTAEKCHRRSLFNLIFLKMVKKVPMPLCYNCVKTEDKANTTCYIMNALEELVDIFDSYE